MIIGTDYLLIIILWCGQGLNTDVLNFGDSKILQCRREKIECVRELKNFTTDDVIDKCLVTK